MRVCSLTILCLIHSAFASGADGDVDYVRDIKPIFSQHCFSCHGALKQESGLRLDTGRLIRKGGDSGAAVVVAKPHESSLVTRITETDASLRMPPEGEPLLPAQVTLIRKWIAAGAKSPGDEQSEPDPREHWAFRKPVRHKAPVVKATSWVRNPIDAFILAQHEQRGLTPLQPASSEILLRRVYLDLIGLPPTRDELHAFLSDDSPEAYERVVDRLLGSKHYGERWGRHWMDVWRYSDWYGRRQVNDVRNSYPHIWRWRDWIIDSLNNDKGYNQMVREMLAADELYPEDDSRMPALGFIVRNWFSLNYDTWKQDLVEHTGKAFLGLRLNCAHCHDHKYDPISQQEYFQFRAFFEPLEFRHDRVPGGPALSKYIRYTPSSGGSLKPIEAGLPRVYDHFFDDKTHMYRLGDTRDRFDRPPVEPAALAILGGDKLPIEPVALPVVASYPGLKPFIQKAEIEQREQAVQAAQKSIAEAEAKLEALTKQSDAGEKELAATRQLAETTLNGAKAELESATVGLKAVKARIAADQARYGDSAAPTDELARTAAGLERDTRLAAGRGKLAKAELSLLKSRAAEKPDAKAIKQAESAVVTARKTLAALEKQTGDPGAKYTPFGPTYPNKSTGRRRALANWIADPNNPLTARVAVNHIWMRHFGRPLVESVFDFGRGGKKPTHPELLDWLAVELMEPSIDVEKSHDSEKGSVSVPSQWRMKNLHRLIVTSATYRLSSRAGRDGHPNAAIDSDNTLWWRFDRRRLEAETIRDSMLHVSGQLDATLGGPDIDPKQQATNSRRSLYFTVYPEAGGMMRFMTLFDAPDPCDCYRRTQSIVPQQALAMSNSTLALEAAKKLADQFSNLVAGDEKENDDSSSPTSGGAFISAAFERVLSRSPTAEEISTCRVFLARQKTLYASASVADPDSRSRVSLLRVLLNHNDFVTIH
jgi:mono/diheme cytochrome c family protein